MIFYPHILIFDSGVGGLSIAREISSAHPQCRLTYASDNAQFPYGNKQSDELVERVERVMDALITAAKPDVIVIACNTASTVTLPHLRSCFTTPFVGVVPAIKPAAQISRSKTIGVLATPATVDRPYTHQLIQDHAADCRVILHGSTDLVLQAEQKLLGRNLDHARIQRELERLTDTPQADDMDTIVLACTHFPLLRAELQRLALPRRFHWVDSGEAIARRVGFWLGQLPPGSNTYDGPHQVIFTAPSSSWPLLRPHLYRYFGDRPFAELQTLGM